MRSVEEIVQRAAALHKSSWKDFSGAQMGELVNALTFDQARQFLTDDADPNAWEVLYRDDADVVKAMAEYLPFAYRKAYGQRGLSANRSVDHFLGMSFLIDDQLYNEIDQMYEDEYESYGLFILRHVDKWLQKNHGYECIDPNPEVEYIEG